MVGCRLGSQVQRTSLQVDIALTQRSIARHLQRAFLHINIAHPVRITIVERKRTPPRLGQVTGSRQ